MAMGNPSWGKPDISGMMTAPLTEFERTVLNLNLKPDEYIHSEELREWAERNSHSRYIPELLLNQWGIKAESTV